MKAITFVGLAVVTAGIGALYYVVDKERQSSYASTKEVAAFFPELAQRINDVATVRVQTKDKNFEIARSGKSWGLASKGNYPADVGKIKTLLMALKDAEPLEEKTSNPELYAKIGVLEPEAADSQSTRVVAMDASGKELANLIVGDQRMAQGGGRSPTGSMPTDAYYVRKGSEAQSWLVEGKLAVESDESYWLDRTIVNLDRLRVRAAMVLNNDGERVFVSKASKEATNFDLAGIPEGRELRYSGITSTFGTALSNLTLEDVLPAADFVFSEPPLATASFWTFDHLRVDVQVEEREAKLYAKFTAFYDDSGATAAGAPLPPPPAPPAEVAEGEPAPPAPMTAPEAKPEDIQKEVAELNARIGSWVYVLPTWKKSSFVKRMEELLNEIKPPEESGAAGEGAPAEGGLPPSMSDEDLQKLLQEMGAQIPGETEGDEVLESDESGGGEAPGPPEKEGGETPPADDGGGGGR